MILLGTSVAFCGVLCLLIPTERELVPLCGLVIIGFGYAPIFPCIIHSTPANFGAENSGAIIGIQMASAYAGTTLMPPLYGIVGRAVGFGIMPLFLAAYLVLMVCMVEKTFRITGNAG